MSWFAKKKQTPAEAAKATKKQVRGSQREVDKEIREVSEFSFILESCYLVPRRLLPLSLSLTLAPTNPLPTPHNLQTKPQTTSSNGPSSRSFPT